MVGGLKKSKGTIMKSRRSLLKHKFKGARIMKKLSNKELIPNSKRSLKSKEADIARKAQLKKRAEKKKKEEAIEKEELEFDEAMNSTMTGNYFNPSEKFNISEEDDKILRQFRLDGAIGGGDDKKKKKKESFIGSSIFDKIEDKIETQKQEEIKEDILKDPKITSVYSDIATLLKEYTSGKLPKAFKFIPMMDQWEKVLQLTKPEEWAPQAMQIATKVFSSSLDAYQATKFYEKYLLPAIRKDIKQNHKLNYHYYFAMKDAFYKPAAWFKGLVFPLCRSQDCTIREATIIGSILNKLSIPVLHTSTAIMMLCEMEYCAALCIFMKIMIEKRYSLPLRVITAIVDHFKRFENDPRQMPVIWHQNLLSFVKLYSYAFDEMQREALKQLIKKKHHHLITPEINKALMNVSKEQIINQNLSKSYNNENVTMTIE